MTLEEYLEKGQNALEQEDLQTAREAFEAAIEEEETYAPAWHGLGHVLLRDGQLDQAAECYEYAVGQDESLTPPWTDLGHLAAQQDEEQQATQFYKKAIQLDPQHSEPWNGLGILYASKLGKPTEAARCFLRAEHLGQSRHANNIFTIFSQLPPQPFFSYRTNRDHMPLAAYPQWKNYQEVVLEEALPLQAYLSWQNLQIENGQAAPAKWEMWQGIIHFLMGDPAIALSYLNIAQAETAETDLMIAYYQIQCAWDFVQSEAAYMEAALAKAETYVPQLKSSGWRPFAKKKAVAPTLPREEFLPCYYAGLIFIENDELKKAMSCLERIEQDFMPAAYLALWLTEEMVLPKKKIQKAEALLQSENRERQFTEGIAVHQLDGNSDTFLQHLTFVNHYLELADAIEIFHYYAEFEGNPHDFEIHMAKDQRPFYQLWELPAENKTQFVADFHAHYYRQIENALPEQLALLANSTNNSELETAFTTAIDSGDFSARSTPLLTAYFQYKGQLEIKSRQLLNLYALLRPEKETEDSGEGESEEHPLPAPKLPNHKIRFLIDALSQPEEQQNAGTLAEHFEIWRFDDETPPTTFSDFQEELEAFIATRPIQIPEPKKEEGVDYDVIGEEEL